MMKGVLRTMFLFLLTSEAWSQEVQTVKGRIRGETVSVLSKDVDVFHKIPYAKPPVGNLRFRYPEEPDSWEPEVKDGRNWPSSCYQSGFPILLTEEFRQYPQDYSEDCLYLTVVRPTNNKGNLTVMVWIHGGGFVVGSPNVVATEGHIYAAERDVIVVSIAYRLGAFGFAYLGPSSIPGNMGMMDQVLALKWIKDNIAFFGGDPGKVTIFGESAGSVSVGMHLMSPLSRDLFQRAILQSGSPLGQWAYLTAEEVKTGTNKFAVALGCETSDQLETLKCLSKVSVQNVLNAQLLVMQTTRFTTPVIDGYFLPDSPNSLLEESEYNKKEIIIGVTADDGSFFVGAMAQFLRNVTIIPDNYTPTDPEYAFFLKQSVASQTPFPLSLRQFYESLVNPEQDISRLNVVNRLHTAVDFACPSVKLGAAYANTNDVYEFRFDHRSSICSLPEWLGVTHSYDIEYAYGFTLNDSIGFTQEEKDLGSTMMTYWTNFAKSGNPNTPESVPVKWLKYDKNSMNFQSLNTGNKLGPKQGLFRHDCVFVNDILPMIAPQNPEQTTPVHCVNGGMRPKGYILLFVTMLALIWSFQV